MSSLGDFAKQPDVSRVKSKADLLSLYSLAEESLKNNDFPRACRFLEIIKEISQAEVQLDDVDWNSPKIKDLTMKCTRDLGKTYYELKCFRHIIPLLESAIWNGSPDDQFFEDSTLLIKAYIHLEEYISAHAVANLIQKYLENYTFQNKEDEIKVLITLIDGFLKGGQVRLEKVMPLCDRVLSLTRDGNHVEDRITTFLAKSSIALATVSSTSALVFSDQATSLAQSVNDQLVAKSKMASAELLILEHKYQDALVKLNEIEQHARNNTTSSPADKRILLARTEFLIGYCSLKLCDVSTTASRGFCCSHLQKGVKLALSASTAEEQVLLLNIWELLAEIYHIEPDFVQMEHGLKCCLQLLSNGIAKLSALVEACEPIAESLVLVISKSSRLYLELECSLADAKTAIETVEWVRNSILLSKIPCRRLMTKLSRPLTYTWIERLVARYDKSALFIYFADVGRGNSRSLCTWVFVPGQGCVFFVKTPSVSTKSGKTLSELVSNCLHSHSQSNYVSERRLLPSNFIQSSAPTFLTAEERKGCISEVAEMLFSRLPSHLWNDAENVFIFPDGQLLALPNFFDQLVNHWLRVSLPESQAIPKKVYSLPSLLFLEICLENQITTLSLEENHVNTVIASKLGGMHEFFQNQRALNNKNAQPVRRSADEALTSTDTLRPLARAGSARLVAGTHTIATLTTKSSSGGDVCTSSLYPLASSNSCVIPNRAVFFGNPSLPADEIPVNGTIWRPPILAFSQKEILYLSKQIHSPYFYLGPQCTKKAFLDCCRDSTLLHLATYVSFCNGVVAFSFSSVDAVSKTSASRENIYTPLDVSGAKLIPTEIACLPLHRAKLVTISSCQSAAELEQTIEFSRNHIGNSVYILPAAFLLAGAHAIVIPRLELSDKELLDGFAKLYTKTKFGCNVAEHDSDDIKPNEQSQEYFYSALGVNSLLDMKRLAHGMLDQEIQKAITKAQQARFHLVENETFSDDLNQVALTNSRWFEKVRQLVCWMAKASLPNEELDLLRVAIENPPNSNELGPLPRTVELQQFLKWLGFHIVSLDEQLTMLFSPLQTSPKLFDKVSLLLGVLYDLLYGDIVLAEAAIDLLENLTIDQLFDIIQFCSVVKHTTFTVQITDQTAARLFDDPRIRSFLYLVGFFNVRNSVIFRSSTGNCKRFDVIFRLFTALFYNVPNQVLVQFIPLGGDQTESSSPPHVVENVSIALGEAPNKLRSLNYIVAQGPTMATANSSKNLIVAPKRIIAAEPIFHLRNNEIAKAELDAKVNLASRISVAVMESREQIRAAKGVFTEQLNLFDKMATTLKDREICKLPNRKTSDRIKVKAGATPSQTRTSVGYFPPVNTSVINNERGRLNAYFDKTKNAVATSCRQEIEALIAKYTTTTNPSDSENNNNNKRSADHPVRSSTPNNFTTRAKRD